MHNKTVKKLVSSMITNRRIYILLFSFLLLFFSGCEKETIGKKEEEVSFDLDLVASSDFNVVTRAQYPDTSLVVPEITDFKIQLFNTADELLREWATYSSVPHPIKIQAGKFRIKASYGNPDKSGFDCPSFAGDTTVQLLSAAADKGIRENRITLSAKFANVLASVRHRESLKTHYKDYNTQIITSHDTVTFNKEEKRIAFFPVEDLKVVVNLTKHDSTTYSISATTLTNTKAAELYRLYVDVEGGGGNEKLLLSFDSSTIEKPIEIELSDDWQSKKKPYLTPAFDTTGYHSFIRGESCKEGKFYTLITAVGKIGSCKIKTNSQSLIDADWPAEVDLLNLTSANRNRLNKFGFTWSEKMLNANMAELDFSGIVAHLPAEDHTLTVEVADICGQVSAPLSIHFRIVPPEFRLLPPERPAIIRSLKYPFTVQMNGGDPDNIVIEYLNEYPDFGVKEWTPCEITSRAWNDTRDKVLLQTKINMNKAAIQFRAKYDKKISDEVTLTATNPTFQLEKQEPEWAHRVKLAIKETDGTNTLIQNSLPEEYFIEISKDGTNWTTANYNETSKTNESIKLQAIGLDAGQTYHVRAGFDTKTNLGICYSAPITIETEAAAQVPNAGMEDWHSNKITEDGTDLSNNSEVYWNKWYPWDENNTITKGWNTLNRKTTQYGAKPSVFIKPTPPYVGCCYTTTSGTLRTEEKNNGKYAALIRTVGWGKGNTAAVFSNNMGTCENVTPGQLYLGTYDASTQEPQYGYPFTSRPNKLKFYYKYTHRNPADYGHVEIQILDAAGNIIASNSMNLTQQGTYSAIELPLDYGTSQVKAASISIVFKSSINSACWEPKIENLTPPPGSNLSDGEYVGSQLYIDDIELIYE